MKVTDRYLKQWIKETYPLMATNDDLDELDWYDMQKFSVWIVKLFAIPDVINLVCIAPKGECDRKPEDVCKECKGCKYLKQTCL